MQFQLWWMINSMAEAMINPFQRIALCLSFIRGEQVDNWVVEKINQLRRAVLGDPVTGIPPTHLPTDEALWNDFGADFRQAYQDTAAEENAYTDLKNLHMTEDRIDEHIAHFEVLLVKAGWNRSNKGSINLFFNGLTKSVQRKILSLYAILPITLDEWQSAARQVVQRYRLMDIKLGPWRPREYEPNSKVGWNQGRQVSGQGRNPDTMDIDVTEIDVNAAQAGKPVTCYYCNNEGHMKKDCCKFKAAQQKGEDKSLGAGTTATTFKNNKARGEARRASSDPDSLMVHINRLRIEDHWDFMEHLFGLETSDHAEETAYLRATKVHTMYARKTKAIYAGFKLLTMQ